MSSTISRQHQDAKGDYPEHIPHFIREMWDLGYVSTSELSEQLNVPWQIPGRWIIKSLGIEPARVLYGQQMYWSEEQVEAVRRALIARLEGAKPSPQA